MDQDPKNQKDPDDNDNFGRNMFFWLVIILLMVGFFNMFQQKPQQHSGAPPVSYSDLIADADAGKIADVTLQGEEIYGHYTDGRTFLSYLPPETDVVSRLEKTPVRINAKPTPTEKPTIWSIL